MMSATATVDRPSGVLGSLLTALFFRCASKHAKRIFYIASLCGQFDHYSQRRSMAVSQLNQAMRLALREDALTVPQVVQTQVWQGSGLETILTPEVLVKATTADSIRALARQVVDISRKWWYADAAEMTNDVTQALTAQREYLLEEVAFA